MSGIDEAIERLTAAGSDVQNLILRRVMQATLTAAAMKDMPDSDRIAEIAWAAQDIEQAAALIQESIDKDGLP